MKRYFKRIFSIVIAMLMIFAMLPNAILPIFAEEPQAAGQVRVIISNDTYKAESAAWTGTLVNEWVDIDENSTMMSCVLAALGKYSYSQEGADSNYITSINGLAAFDGGTMSGWMGTLNDWFTNEGFAAFTVKDGKLSAGDEIHLVYTCDYGTDCGGDWKNTNKTLDGIQFSAGTLNTTFDKDTKSYTLTLEAGVNSITITPTASCKNYQVRTYKGTQAEGTEYKRTASIPVANGDVITVVCGDPSWPSMNDNTGEKQTYTFTIAQSTPAPTTECEHEIVDHVCTKCGDVEYTLQLVPETAEIAFDDGKLTDKGIQTISSKKYHVYSLIATNSAITYTATDGAVSLGSGQFTLDKDSKTKTYTLVRHNFYAANAKGMEDWQLNDFCDKTDSHNSIPYTLGTKFNDNGTAKQCALLIGGHKYGGNVQMNSALEENYYLTAFADFTVNSLVNAAQNKTLPINAYKQFKLTIPSDADKVEFFEQTANYVVKPMSTSEMTTKDNGDGTTTYLFKSKSVTYGGQHTWRASKDGKITLAGYMSNLGSYEITEWPETSQTETKTTAITYDDNNVLLNIDDSKDTNELNLKVGDTFKLRAFRAWQIIDTTTANRMIEPDFHCQVIYGDDVVLVTPVTSFEEGKTSGNAGSNWMNITALKEGTAIVAVWYDAIIVTGSGVGNGVYGASDPSKYGYVVVTVGEDETVAITPISSDGDWDAEFDTVYYLDEEGTFAFTSDDATSVSVTNLNGTTVGTAKDVTKVDGKWNVPVASGSNLITITSANGTDYRLVRANKIKITYTNVTTTESNEDISKLSIKAGDTLKIHFEGLDMPIHKMSGIYNPGYQGTAKTAYKLDGKFTLMSTGTQYDFIVSEKSDLSFVVPSAGTHTLEGYISLSSMGDDFGNHRNTTDNGRQANMNASEKFGSFSVLPSISFTAGESDTPAFTYDDVTALDSVLLVIGGTTAWNCYALFDQKTNNAVKYNNEGSFKTTGWKGLACTVKAKSYYNSLSMTYWYEGEEPVTVPLTGGVGCILDEKQFEVKTGKLLNVQITVTPADPSLGAAKTYSYVVIGGTSNLKYVHPVITGLTITDKNSNPIELDKAISYTLTDYAIEAKGVDSINLSATMLQKIKNATANTADKADTVTVTCMKNGSAVGSPIKVAPADENAYPTGSWTYSNLDISKADSVQIKVESYVDGTTRVYTIKLNKDEQITTTPVVNTEEKSAEVTLNDNTVNNVTVNSNLKLDLSTTEVVSKVAVSVPTSVMTEMSKAEDVTIQSNVGSITFDKKAFSGISQGAEQKDVTISIENVEAPANAPGDAADATFIELTAKDSDGKNLFDGTGSGKATITIPYEKEVKEGQEIKVFYFNGVSYEKVDCTYDATNKTVTFVVEHFSGYLTTQGEKALDYTVKAIADKATVHAGEDVAVSIKVCDNNFNGAEITLEYNKDQYTFGGAIEKLNGVTVKDSLNGGLITITCNSSDALKDVVLAKLKFTANALSTSADTTFTVKNAKAGTTKSAYTTEDWNEATKENASVKIAKQFNVKFVDKDEALIGSSYLVDEGSKLGSAKIPSAPELDYLDFDKWYVGETGYTAEQISNAAVTKDVVYKASYNGKQYAVTLAEGLTGNAKATYGTDYIITVSDYNANLYVYTVNYAVGQGKTQKAVDKGNGTFEIAGANITNDINVTLVKKINNISVKTVADYINGYTLILLKGEGKYAFDGKNMYKDEYVIDSNTYNYAYLYEGAITEDAVVNKISATTTSIEEILVTKDINLSSKVSFEDANAVFGIMNKVALDSTTMSLMLRADINRDGKVDGQDIILVLNDSNYKNN